MDVSYTPKALADLVVELLLQVKRRGTALGIGLRGNPRTRRVKGMHGCLEHGILRRSRQEFDLQSSFHIEGLYHKDNPSYRSAKALESVSSTGAKEGGKAAMAGPCNIGYC
jgi:hypothetical protein